MTAQRLQGWFRSIREVHTCLIKKKSEDGAPELTEREEWIKSNFGFLKQVIRHRKEPVESVSDVLYNFSFSDC